MGGWAPAFLAHPLLVAAFLASPRSVTQPVSRSDSRKPMAAVLGADMLQILRVDDILLTRIEHNCEKGLSCCTDVVVYNHGFPDSSVIPCAIEDFAAACAGTSQAPPDGYFASRLPRKWCEYLMKQLPNTAFVAFNTRGVPGSSLQLPEKVEFAPENFEGKTLSGDLEDIAAVAAFMRERCPFGRITVCGMSTGAFLALAFAARADLHPAGGLAGCFTLACVHDIPSAAHLDFSEEQRAAFDADGFCLKEFFPYGGANNPQFWKLSRGYYDSYAMMPSADEVAARLTVPTLLLHGADDRHVPPSHGEALQKALERSEAARVELVILDKGNHFLSSTGPLNKALTAIKKFVLSLGDSSDS